MGCDGERRGGSGEGDLAPAAGPAIGELVSRHRNPARVRALSAEIAAAEREIDAIVHRLFDLTPDEIALLKSSLEGQYSGIRSEPKSADREAPCKARTTNP